MLYNKTEIRYENATIRRNNDAHQPEACLRVRGDGNLRIRRVRALRTVGIRNSRTIEHAFTVEETALWRRSSSSAIISIYRQELRDDIGLARDEPECQCLLKRAGNDLQLVRGTNLGKAALALHQSLYREQVGLRWSV